MAIRKYRATSPGIRHRTDLGNEEITASRPHRALTESLKKSGGRNVRGKVTAYHRGGGHRRKYRIIDFRRDKAGVPAKVVSVEYDPNRTARIALVSYTDGAKAYVLAPDKLAVGDTIVSGVGSDIKVGNSLPLKNIPLGTVIHNIELRPGQGGRLVRSAGTLAQLVAREGDYAQVKLPSGEVRMIPVVCRATIGQVGNLEQENVFLGKAGRTRWRGRRPHVRGVAMNPVDHPHGGGEGKTSGGRHPVTPWGKPTKGAKTRGRKPSDKFIVKRRNAK
jgi:large subunit ribosomal protein L2